MTKESSVRIQRLSGWFLAVCAFFLLAFVHAANAAPGTQVWTGQPGGTSPDIMREGDISIYGTDGGNLSNTAGTINFTINGSPFVGFCIDSAHPFSLGSEQVDMNPIAAPTQVERAIGWILTNRTPTGASTPEKRTQAAISQVAVWMLLGNQVHPTDPTDDATVNAAAAALKAEALAAVAQPSSLAVTSTAPAAGATSTSVQVVGRPGASVNLVITSGAGTLSANNVVLDAAGKASVNLSVAGPGTVVVSASSAGDASVVRVTPNNRSLQSTVYALPTTLSASTSVAFTPKTTTTTTSTTPTPPVVPPTTTTSTTPTTTVAQAPAAKLAIVKTGPASARSGATITYTIRVTNTGKGEARNVSVTDITPSGLTLVSPKGTMSGARVTWSVGTLAPGASRTITVKMRSKANLRGTRVNVATATATGVAKVTAQASTVFTPAQTSTPVVRPAVTG